MLIWSEKGRRERKMERGRVWPGQLEVLVHKPDPKVQPPKVVQRISNPEAPG